MLPHKKNKRSSSYRRSQVNEWVLSLRTNFHIKLWIVSGGLSIYEYIITHWITCVFWVKKRAVCKSLFVYFGKYYEHVIDNSVYNMQLFMSQISVETLLIIKCTWMFGKQNLFQLRNTWKKYFWFSKLNMFGNKQTFQKKHTTLTYTLNCANSVNTAKKVFT